MSNENLKKDVVIHPTFGSKEEKSEEERIREIAMLTVTQKHKIIDSTVGKMSHLEKAAVQHFIETGSINGSFRIALYEIMQQSTDEAAKAIYKEIIEPLKKRVAKLISLFVKQRARVKELMDEQEGYETRIRVLLDQIKVRDEEIEPLKKLLYETAVRCNITLPVDEDGLKWFEEKTNARTKSGIDFFLRLNDALKEYYELPENNRP